MQIGEVAERTSLSLRTLRHYDEIGLLRPSGRSEGGFRLYSEADVTRLLVIRRMKPLGFTLDEMSEVMRLLEVLGTGNDEAPDVDRLSELEQVIARAEERRETLRRQVEMADEFIEALRGQRGDATGR
jgi:DNA-binding transcriptional MerR regulator